MNSQKQKEYRKRYYQNHKQNHRRDARQYYNKHKKKQYLTPPEIGCEHKRMLRYEQKYQIFQNGQVWSYKTGKWKKASLQSNGRYYFYCLSNGTDKPKTQYIHRLIAQNFILNRQIPKGYQVHHQDTNTLNCSPDNLLVVDPETHKQFHKTKKKTKN